MLIVKRLAIVGLALAFAAIGSAQWVATSDNWGYQGSMVKFASLTDALANQNAVSSHSFSRRDGSLYMLNNRSDFDATYPNANQIGTAWYYTTQANTNSLPKDDPGGDRYYSGWGNPNNNTDSFLQLADLDGSTRSASNGEWTDGTYTSFHVTASGTNATYADDYARLWNGLAAGAAEPTRGTFLTYSLDATFSGLNGVVDGGYITSTVEPTSVSGTFTGIFQNTSSSDPGSNGFCVFNLTMDQSVTPWAIQQGNAALNGDLFPSYFSAAPVPEPASMAVLGLGAMALIRRRRRK
jgi:hypothetical protein